MSVQVWALGGLCAIAMTLPAGAETKQSEQETATPVSQEVEPVTLQQVKRPATSVKEWMAQVEAAQVKVTGVRVEPAAGTVRVVLETSAGLSAVPTRRSEGNTLVTEIENAVLALPEGNRVAIDKPIEGISAIEVIQGSPTTVQVRITGATAVPVVEVVPSAKGLVLSAEADEEVAEEEVTVTGEGARGYRVPNASTATRTDTPIRDIPASIQVVPQEVLRDQQATRLEEALRNVPGVVRAFSGPFSVNTFTIRGFAINETSGNNFLRDGLPDPTVGGVAELSNIEQIEVLKGPASVLFGFGNPGGTINLVTKKPLPTRFYSVEATIGNYDFYRGAIDLSGPLNESKTVLYRLNASYRNSGSFIDFFDSNYFSLSPVISIKLGERTNISLDGEYINVNSGNYPGVPLNGTLLPNPNGEIPRNRNYGEPSDEANQTIGGVGYRLEHKLSDNWTLRNALRASFRRYDDSNTNPTGGLILNNRILNRFKRNFELNQDTYALITDIVGKFSTGSIQHQLVAGFDLTRFTQRRTTSDTPTQIDLFNPVYNQPLAPLELFLDDDTRRDSLGIYVQDQVTLAENLKVLLGLRFDTFEQKTLNLFANTEINQSDTAFSPRIGIVYQPIPPISLYAGYSRSFSPPAVGTARDRTPFLPERGTQYEVGVKADFNNRLSATLAFYDLTRTNVLTTDLIDTRFSVQTGEQRSRGIEFSIGGEILPGWNIIAGYTFTDAEVTKDNAATLVGNQLNNTPRNTFNLWTTYEFQTGELQGLGFGVGLFYVGDRQGNLTNTFELPGYLRTDAAIFYKRDRFRAAINVRNLFDVEFFEFALNQNRLSYGQPLTVQGTISWQF